MRVVLDTSILRQDPSRKRASFRALERLARSGKIAVVLPYIVEREFVTQEAQLLRKSLEEARTGIKASLRRPITDARVRLLEEAAQQIENALKEVTAAAEEVGAALICDFSAIQTPIGDEQAKRVLTAYFGGTPPFKSVKTRDDIPDAFLYEAIVDLAREPPSLHFASGDENLRVAVSRIPNVAVHKSLEALLGHPDFAALLREAAASDNIQLVRQSLSRFGADFVKRITDRVGAAIQGLTVGDQTIPEDDHEATVLYHYSLDEATIDVDAMEYLGDGEFIVPFAGEMRAGLTYPVLKTQYYVLPDEVARRMSISDVNDHYFEVEEESDLTIHGMLTFALPDDLLVSGETTIDDIESGLSDADFWVDSVATIDVAEIPK